MHKCFIVGPPRSGTTWLQRLLQSHPKVCGGEESHFIPLFAQPMTKAREMLDNEPKVGPLIYMDETEYDAMFRDMSDRVFAALYNDNPTADVHVEKTPTNALHLDEITRLFPDAAVIFMIRDSRAVVASMLHAGRTWGSHWAPTKPKRAATMWWGYTNAVRKWQCRNPGRTILTVKYEDLAADPLAEVNRALGFLGLDPLVGLPETDKPSDPKDFIRKRGTDAWKSDLSTWEKAVTWRYTRKAMRELGYRCDPLT